MIKKYFYISMALLWIGIILLFIVYYLYGITKLMTNVGIVVSILSINFLISVAMIFKYKLIK